VCFSEYSCELYVPVQLIACKNTSLNWPVMYQWTRSCLLFNLRAWKQDGTVFNVHAYFWLAALHDTLSLCCFISKCTKRLFVTVMRFVVVVHLFSDRQVFVVAFLNEDVLFL